MSILSTIMSNINVTGSTSDFKNKKHCSKNKHGFFGLIKLICVINLSAISLFEV